MLDGAASAAWRRPWAFLAAAAGLLVALLAIAWGAPDGLGHGPPSAGEPERPDLIVLTSAETRLSPQVSGVALDTITANLEADPGVDAVTLRDPSRDPGLAVLEVSLSERDAGDRRATAERLEAEIDPGPLQVSVGGRIAELEEAEAVVRDDIWRLELLVVPLALLLLVATVGPRLALGPPVCAAIAVAGALAGLRLAGGLGDPSALAIVPAAAVGLALGIELPLLLAARWEDESRLAGPAEALRATLAEGAGPLAFAALAAVLASAGLVATSYGPAASIVLGCGLAATWALVGSAMVMPALFALSARRGAAGDENGLPERDRRLASVLAGLPRVLTRRGLPVGLATVLATAACLALAYPALDATSEALSARDLPSGSVPAQVERAAGAPQGGGDAAGPAGQGGSLLSRLPLAAAVAAGLLAVAFAGRSRSLRAAPAAVAALLPAAAACGVAALVLGEDALVRLGIGDPGPLSAGAVAAATSTLAAVAGARTAASLDAIRYERELDPGPPGVAERAAGLAMPAAAVGTMIAASAAGAVMGIELDPARQFGLLVLAGLLVDLLLVRSVALAAMARWGGPRGDHEARGRRVSLRWPRWRPSAGQKEGGVEEPTASPR